MATIAEALAVATQHHRAGRLQQAEAIYRQVLAVEPRQADALHLLGMIAFAARQFDQALALIGQAIASNGTMAAFHANRGLVLEAMGRHEEALASYREALRQDPGLVNAHLNLGQALLRAKQAAEALGHFEKAVRLDPRSPEAHYGRGGALAALDQDAEAVRCYEQALQLRPGYGEVHHNLGNALRRLGKLDEAVVQLREAVRLLPGFVEAINNLGAALAAQKKPDEARACYDRALQLRPDHAETLVNLGNLLADEFRHEEAMACFRRALELQPKCIEGHYNLGNSLMWLGSLDEALTSYARTLALRPDHAEAHFNRAWTWLMQGDFAHGWPEYEWRWRTKSFVPRSFRQPRWDGSPLEGRTILLWHEQGIGDTIQFIRYTALVKQRGGRIIVECRSSLMELLARCPGIDRVVAMGSRLPPFDVHAPLLGLPAIFRTTTETIPANVPYLHADARRLELWRLRLEKIKGFKVGISWQGSVTYQWDRLRSFHLREFAPLARLPAVRLISMQKGMGTEQIPETAGLFPVVDLGDDLDPGNAGFLDSAAVLMHLDLVITADTALGHLAGAMGRPVWIAVPFVSDYRWFLDRTDSPWYPTVRLFRQKTPGDWPEVFGRIATELARLAARS